jgi:hypothetical protein
MEICEEICVEIHRIRGEILMEIPMEIPMEIREEIRGEICWGIRGEIHGEIRGEIRGEILPYTCTRRFDPNDLKMTKTCQKRQKQPKNRHLPWIMTRIPFWSIMSLTALINALTTTTLPYASTRRMDPKDLKPPKTCHK